MKTSPLDAEHRALKAHMGAFAGWDMPISYAGTVKEHTAVRTSAGVFDVSHLGKIVVRGSGAAELLDRALTNRMTDLEFGRARYTLMLNDEGGIVDDMIVYSIAEGDLLVVPNASNVDEVERRLRTHDAPDAQIERNDDAIIAIQGPRSREILRAVLPDVPELDYMHCSLAGHVGVARSGYTGEHGYEVFTRPDDAPAIWTAALEAGAVPAGLAARDTLRLEMGYPLHGNDLDQDTMPSEAGLNWAVGKNKDDFTGRKAIESRLPRKKLIGIVMNDRVIPRAHCEVRTGGKRIGECTSGTFSPTLRNGIALAYVEPGSVDAGDDVELDVRGKTGIGRVAKPPFVQSTPK